MLKREWGQNPRTETVLYVSRSCPSAKAGHWETGKAGQSRLRYESEDLQGIPCCCRNTTAAAALQPPQFISSGSHQDDPRTRLSI